MIYVSNAFSLGMVPREQLRGLEISPCNMPDLGRMAFMSCVGHEDTARVLGVPFNRISVTLKEGDTLYVAQLRGGRLPEGCTTLPEGFEFDWVRVHVRGLSELYEEIRALVYGDAQPSNAIPPRRSR